MESGVVALDKPCTGSRAIAAPRRRCMEEPARIAEPPAPSKIADKAGKRPRASFGIQLGPFAMAANARDVEVGLQLLEGKSRRHFLTTCR